MTQIQLVVTILYVKGQETSTYFYEKIFRKPPGLNVPGMNAFKLSENCQLGLMPGKGIAKILAAHTAYPDEG